MKLMDGPWRRQAAGAAFGFAVILSQSPTQAQFYGNWGPYPFPMPPMPPPVIYPRAAQPGYFDIANPAFGYKNHIGIDRAHGLIRTWRATDAAAMTGRSCRT